MTHEVRDWDLILHFVPHLIPHLIFTSLGPHLIPRLIPRLIPHLTPHLILTFSSPSPLEKEVMMRARVRVRE